MTDKIKELEAKLAVTSNPKEKIDMMNALARELESNDLHRVLSLSKKAYEQAKINQFDGRRYDKGMADKPLQSGPDQPPLG